MSSQVKIFLPVEDLVSVSMSADWSGWWLLKVGAGRAISEKKMTMKFATSYDSSFHRFLWSMQCPFNSGFTHSRTSFKIGVHLLQSAAAFFN